MDAIDVCGAIIGAIVGAFMFAALWIVCSSPDEDGEDNQ